MQSEPRHRPQPGKHPGAEHEHRTEEIERHDEKGVRRFQGQPREGDDDHSKNNTQRGESIGAVWGCIHP